MNTFRIGEKALLLPCPERYSRGLAALYFGTTVTVKAELQTAPGAEGGFVYDVETFDGHGMLVVPRLLQKLPPSDPAFVKWRDALVREFAMDARVRATHPAIVGMLELVGQSPLQTAREALAK